jgi:N-methylhydantoinase B
VAQRHIIGQLLPDVVLGCLRKAMPKQIPAEGSSCMYDLPMRGGFDATSDKDATRFAVELTHNGGTGARPGKDGLSVTAFPSGVYGSQVEVTESTSPLLVRRRELRPDSGGAGKFRGGLGQIIEIENREHVPFDFFGTVDRVKYPARGCFGGHDGACGHLALKSGRLIKGKGKQQIPAGETLVFQTPGGAGYGDPRKRPPALVAKDYAAGLISRPAVKRHYGVILKRDGSVDTRATQAQRKL